MSRAALTSGTRAEVVRKLEALPGPPLSAASLSVFLGSICPPLSPPSRDPCGPTDPVRPPSRDPSGQPTSPPTNVRGRGQVRPSPPPSRDPSGPTDPVCPPTHKGRGQV